MKVSAKGIVFDDTILNKDAQVELSSNFFNSYDSIIKRNDCFAYPPLINPHDHLIGNWFPRAGGKEYYPNAHIWVEDMKKSDSVKERDQIFLNTIPMDFTNGNGMLLATLGGYKNIFSGVIAVQDHSPIQKDEYYEAFPINVIREYRQCHSLALGNFWGGEEPQKEMELSQGKMPFIVHLAEGSDELTANEFARLKELDLLQPNTLIIHGIALKEKEIIECAEKEASICWCPFSNHFLIGKTLDINSCLKYGVNVVIGTDSTLSGSINLFEEMQFAHKLFPAIPNEKLFKMVAKNAKKALLLSDTYGSLSEHQTNGNLLLVKAKEADPYDNLLTAKMEDIVLLMYEGKPIYGNRDILHHFDITDTDYYFYKKKDTDYFVIGHPEMIIESIDNILGYKKFLPFLPFQ